MNDLTSGGTYTTYNFEIKPKQNYYGWICPKCENCLAPSLQHCPFCRKPYYATISGGTSGNIGGVNEQ